MNFSNTSRSTFVGLCLLPFAFGAALADSGNRGLDIARKAERMNSGYVDAVAELRMELYDSGGELATRDLTIYSLEMENDGDRSIVRFKSPRDVKGTALLTWSHTLKPDEQWLYLPSISRVKRISSRNKSGSFMGSEFSFEDLGSVEVEKYTYHYIGEENVDGVDTYKLHQVPKYANSGYSKQFVWVDKTRYVVIKTQFFDKGEKLLKTLNNSDFKKYKNRFWRSHHMEMTNHQTGKSTVLAWKKFSFTNSLRSSMFTKSRLGNFR